MTAPRAVLLDALDTLVELEPPAPLLRAELRRRGIEVAPEAAARAVAAEIRFYRASLGAARDRATLAALRRRCTAVLAGALGAPVAALSAAELQAALLAALRFRPFPEVPGALRRMRAAHVRLVVVSNWDWSLHEVLARTGLAAHLDGALASAELGVAKPAPAIFAHALTLAGVPAAQALHAGDSWEEDVLGARAAGIEPVLMARGGERPPDPSVRTAASLDAVADLVV